MASCATAEDFGTRGETPSHPELLDWLANPFVEEGWSVKRLVRTIVTSSTYRQSAKIRPELQSKDPDNALLARQSRDEIAGRADPRRGPACERTADARCRWPDVRPPQPAGVASLAYGSKGDDRWSESKGADGTAAASTFTSSVRHPIRC